MSDEKRCFYTYVDYTSEFIPRPFYVGKGSDTRLGSYIRNKRHAAIVVKYGVARKIVLETDDELESFLCEKKLISELHTYVRDPLHNGIGCNYTMGGEGASGINSKCILKCDAGGNVLEEFASVAIASKAAGVTSLTSLLVGTRKCLDIGGFMWKYKYKHSIEPRKKYKTRANCKQVCVTYINRVEIILQSISDASQSLCITRSVLSRVLHGFLPASEVRGLELIASIKFKDASLCKKGLGRVMLEQHRATHSKSLLGTKRRDGTKAKLRASQSIPVCKVDVVTEQEIVRYPSMKVASKTENISKSRLTKLLLTGNIEQGVIWRRLK